MQEPAIALTGLNRDGGETTSLREIDLEIGRGEVVAVLGPRGAGKSLLARVVTGWAEPDSGAVSVLGRRPREALRAGVLTAVRTDTGDDRAEVFVLDEPAAGMDRAHRDMLWRRVRELDDAGRTLLCTTGSLTEAREFASRIVLLCSGTVVADGSADTVRAALSGMRDLRATLRDAGIARLRRLPGVIDAVRRGDRVTLCCSDSDAAVHAMVNEFSAASGIEVTRCGLDQTSATTEHEHWAGLRNC